MKHIIVIVLALLSAVWQAVADEPFQNLRSRQLPGFKIDIPLDSIRLSDPCILADKESGLYYMTGTGGKLWVGRNLNEWTGPYKLIETNPKSWMGRNPDIWAAELHPYKGKYYCFATFTNNKKITGRFKGMDLPRRATHVMVSDVPWGPYRPVSNQNYLPEDRPTLDGTFWVDRDGKPYMVYCGEWISNWDGTLESIQLKDDLSGPAGKGNLLFKASASPWSREIIDGNTVPNRVTDGPWLFRTGTGRLGMIWTSWIYDVYTQGVAYSHSGTLDGPWIQEEDPITPPNYGHGMLFQDLQGRWLMSAHSHRNDNGHYIRIPHLFEVDLSGDKLKVNTARKVSTTGKKLIWSEEFDNDGPLDSLNWNFEKGFVRNHEDQWYQSENAYCKDGLLVLEARKENRANPLYKPGSTEWRSSRPAIEYSSASVNTRGKQEFQYGTMEVRARIPVASGAWPAIWTLGRDMPWPSNGEIDVMEYYRINGMPHILANAAWGKDKPNDAEWNSKTVPFEKFLAKDPDWASKFHIWRMDWDKDYLKIYLDDELINEISLEDTYNGKIGKGTNPMRQPHYVLLDLALGGDHGGPIADEALPMKFEIDYVRIYQ